MPSINEIKVFRDVVVRPALKQTGLWSEVAECLVLGTAAVESGFQYLKQVGGPALGVYQMEPRTHEDLWENYLKWRMELNSLVRGFSCVSVMPGLARPAADELCWNLRYATVMCRVQYLRSSRMLPVRARVESLADYWKTVYNTVAGKGVARDFVEAYNQFIEPMRKEEFVGILKNKEAVEGRIL